MIREFRSKRGNMLHHNQRLCSGKRPLLSAMDIAETSKSSASAHRRSIATAFAAVMWAITVLAPFNAALGQSISNVEVSKTTTTSEPDQATFKVTITGNNFGGDKSKITVVVSPQKTLKSPPTVDDVKDGTTVNASFTAPTTYDLSTVTVSVGANASDPYVLTKASPSQASGKPNQKKFIKVYRSLLDPKVVSDIFGKRIAQRFVVLQVTIANKNDDYQYLIHDLTLDLQAIMPPPPKGGKTYEASSADLSLLRGVAEKGQSMDGRNLTLRILRGAGSVAAGLIGVTTFGSSYAPAVAVFNGPAIAAVAEIFPDYTIGQMNRLSDSAYSTNAIVPKQQSKVVAIFLPQAIFLNGEQRKEFWNDPTTLWAEECHKSPTSETAPSASGMATNSGSAAPHCMDLRYLEVLVDGDFITNVPDQDLASNVPATSTVPAGTPAPASLAGALAPKTTTKGKKTKTTVNPSPPN